MPPISERKKNVLVCMHKAGFQTTAVAATSSCWDAETELASMSAPAVGFGSRDAPELCVGDRQCRKVMLLWKI